MKTNKIIYISSLLLFCTLLLQSCGCGPTFLYNWRPKLWTHPYTANVETGLDSLIDIDGYYLTQDSAKLYSIMFYENGLCISLSTRVYLNNNDNNIPYLNTIYNNETIEIKTFKDEFGYNTKTYDYKKHRTSWGTYQINNDTIKASIIENLIGCDGTRKNIVSMTYLIQDDKQLKQIFVSNSNKEYGYSKELNVPNCTFHPIENKRDSNECPYLKKKWFYQSDKK